ncbi:hypothetical protein [Polynucleobacter sp. IMCC 30228]|uniref:hypothetical protein n=1 Tax=Polynucleobacter sp. IMCC 30228 TaxID=2781011 RepID=UPI001F190047|nr:hypothetical protein [Polynucleobacter sp. IMCC 30228]MCE7526000.1 hypothetical protein [Polynucleobacter sp. IMCC 30228]
MPSINWFTATPGDLIDGRFNSVILEHFYHWITGRQQDLWSPSFFYPNLDVLAFSDNHFGNAFIYALLRILGLSREVAFSAWYVSGCLLNFLVTYIVLRKLHFSVFAASAGAFVFAYFLPAIIQAGHAQLTYRFAIPLAFYALWNFIYKRQISALGLLFLWICVQFYCSIYLGVFLVYLLLAASIAALILQHKNLFKDLKRSWLDLTKPRKIFLSALAIASSISFILLLEKYQQVASLYGFTGNVVEVKHMLPRLESYLIADNSSFSSFVGSWFNQIPLYRHEHQLFIGIGVALIFFIGCCIPWFNYFGINRPYAKDQNAIGKLAFFSLLILFLSTLQYGVGGGQLTSPYEYLFSIPGILSIRAVTRLILVQGLPIAILVALACETLISSLNKNNYFWRAAGIAIVAALLSLEVIFFDHVKTPNAIWTERLNRLSVLLPKPIPAGSVLFVDNSGKETWYFAEVDAMVLAQDLGIPTINGYSGKFPPGHDHQSPNSCIPYMARVQDYGKFHHLTEASTNELMTHIIQIPPSTCVKVN